MTIKDKRMENMTMTMLLLAVAHGELTVKEEEHQRPPCRLALPRLGSPRAAARTRAN